MGLRLVQYTVEICIKCWNNGFDFSCPSCRKVTSKIEYRNPIQWDEKIYAVFNSLSSYDEQLEKRRKQYYEL